MQLRDMRKLRTIKVQLGIERWKDESKHGKVFRDQQDEIRRMIRSGQRVPVGARNLLRLTRQQAAADPFLEMCDVCFVGPFAVNDTFVAQCGHKLCVGCTQNHTAHCIQNNQAVVECFAHDCDQILGGPDVRAILAGHAEEDRLIGMYDEVLAKRAIESMGKSIQCPNKECNDVLLLEEGAGGEGDEAGKVKCLSCSSEFCHKCKVPWHKGSTCEKFQQWLKENGSADESFRQWQLDRQTRACPYADCGAIVERTGGCNRLGCRCGRNFCYRCGYKLVNGYADFGIAGHPCPVNG